MTEVPTRRILVCDDEAVARRAVIRALRPGRGGVEYELCEAADGADCLNQLAEPGHGFHLLILDLHMPRLDGQTTLEELQRSAHAPPVIVLTADASVRSALAAVRAGAVDYLTKPYDIDELRFVVERALDQRQLERENRQLRDEVQRLGGSPKLLGESAPMQHLFESLDRLAASDAAVLITGESGTGKELVARRLHRESRRAEGPFVTLNCAAIPENLVESELFGHRRGAFTGAERDRDGKFSSAHRGTLFLDEIGDMSLTAQAKLLRVLEQREIEPVGGSQPVPVDVRVLAATHRDLKERAQQGLFRQDLLFRLRVVELELSPLRQRGGDVLLLSRFFLDRASARPLSLSPAAQACLSAYSWPGNVRELQNSIERAVIFCRSDTIEPEDLPAEVLQAGDTVATPDVAFERQRGETLQEAKRRVTLELERALVESALEQHAGNVSRAARDLSVHRQSLQQKLRRLGIDPKRYR